MDNLPPSAFSQGSSSQYQTESNLSNADYAIADNGFSAENGAGNFGVMANGPAVELALAWAMNVPTMKYARRVARSGAQVETLLKGQDGDPVPRTSPPQPQENAFTAPLPDDNILVLPEISGLGSDLGNSIPSSANEATASQPNPMFFPSDPQWDMIGLGLEEPLPMQDVIDELESIYFEKIQPMLPLLHRPRYFTNLNLAPHMRPPICLRYMIWCHAASISDKYYGLHNHFYHRARKYAEMDEMKGFGENIITLSHCQTWILIGSYEFRMIYFPRAWLSVGKAARLALMMGLNRLDGTGLDVKQSMFPPKDWTEREERRRTFWMAFCTDRYASIGTGWPMVIDENDIMTNLPASEEAFLKSKPQRTLSLSDIIAGEGVTTLAPFAYVCVLANLFGRNLNHIHRPQPQDNDHDLNGEFWKRHRSHDNILLHIALSLPDHLRLPGGMDDVNVIFANMNIHTSTICLHQAAIFKAEKNKMSNQIVTESKRRCLVAANQISSIMKMVSHVDLTILNPFMSFCLYISARVFVQYLKSRPDDSTVYSSLQFVISALNAMKNKNPLTESFLVQLDVDLEGTGIKAMENGKYTSAHTAAVIQSYCPSRTECLSIYDVRDPTRPGTPDQSKPDSTSQTGPARRTTTLPSRYRDKGAVDSDLGSAGSNAQHFTSLARASAINSDAIGQGGIVDMDMDFSPDFGGLGDRNPPSDHPTPSTLNSSSNTSYSMSGIDNPSPERNSRIPPPPNRANLLPSTISTPFTSLLRSNTSLGDTAPGRTYPETPGWDMSATNPGLSNVDLSSLNVDALSEAQWAQILENNGSGPGWENWRPS
ncbi:Transcription factor [Penicillium waksmanii]|uniref:Transcription factor n=1 Tax=Penicillium waksmanii TaxID=69791 RepID=UPI0025491FF2|nr:Transcription factor [Penicillium waksmanii]KAJ5983789.1 Transcription factor [Penicillium waksmanii]